MAGVLWACVVWRQDAKWLTKYLRTIVRQTVSPTAIAVVDTSGSDDIRTIVAQQANPKIRYFELRENLGFNAGLNYVIRLALSERYEWLATMTVRAQPESGWLAAALEAAAQPRVGMVSTLHMGAHNRVDCLGHNLGPAGQAFDFGTGMDATKLTELLSSATAGDEPVWGPCSGGALYQVAALSRAADLVGTVALVRPFGFKFYNCDCLAYVIRAAGYRHAYSLAAKCCRDRSESTSLNPGSIGLIMNRDINRIANLFEFWQPSGYDAAIRAYLRETQEVAPLTETDRAVARTLTRL